MTTTHMTALEIVHRLLFRALIELREQGQEHKNKVVFHLADLFHNVVLEMENAAEGKTTYEDVWSVLEEKAREKSLEKWLETALNELKLAKLPSLAELTMRLHKATGQPISDCRESLTTLPVEEREKVVEDYEQGRRFVEVYFPLKDPVNIPRRD